MKSYLLVSLLIVTVTAIAAAPFEPLIEHEPLKITEYDDTALPDGRAMRQRRVTCDLLSAGGFIGDTACAANCLSMGKAGGHCNDSGVCVCRSESFKDLWDKRFGG